MSGQHIIQISSFYPPHVGGQENAVYELSTHLAQAGHHVEVITAAQNRLRGTSTEQGVKVHRLWSWQIGHAPIMPGFLAKLRQIATKDSIVHLHVGQAFTPEMVWLASKLRSFAYVAELHIDFRPSGPLGFLLPFYKHAVLQPVLRAAQSVLVLNQTTQELVIHRYNCSRVTMVTNGIDEAFYVLRRPAFLPKPPRTLHLLFVGRLTKQKNCLALLKAIGLTHHKVHLDIVGDGEERDQLDKYIRQYKLPNVTLYGALPRQTVLEFYRNCDALILPSLYEAQPLVLLEAMAAKVPIIGTSVIGVAEHLQGSGIIVPPTPEGLASGIDAYYQQYRVLPMMVKKGYQTMAARRWRHVLGEYEKIYRDAYGH